MAPDNKKQTLLDQAEAIANYHDKQAALGGACGRAFHTRTAAFIRRLAAEALPVPTQDVVHESMNMLDPEIMLFDGLDEALIGTFQRCGEPTVAVYSYERCLDVLVADGLPMDQAEEHMGYNVEGGWFGPRTPAVLHPLDQVVFAPIERPDPVPEEPQDLMKGSESTMSSYEIGQRVGAISNSKGDTVYMFGWGTYQGEEVPPVGTPGPFGMDASQVGPNPKILLDSGDVVFGCQCWWGAEEVIKRKIAPYKNVEMVPVPARMEPEKADGDDEGAEA
jgi:hypothetical protein